MSLNFGPDRMGTSWYEEWFCTEEYTLLYGHRDETEARSWARSIVERAQLAPGARVLDMACGRGRHARAFRDLGLNVHGVDLSQRSIEEARAKVPGATFDVHDMREVFAIEAFDLVVCLFSSLGYTDDPADDEAIMRTAITALKPGGLFVLDFMNTIKVQQELVPEENVVRADTDFALRRSIVDGRIVKEIVVQRAGRERRFEEHVRLYRREDLVSMVLRSGANLEGLTDGPPMTPFDPLRSDRCVLWARKPE
ncbi:MAG: methyltransferase domain-containing protein [Flavobacteriales bacterium]|nr:methyltransferase domain-containing protein [Flavobacteriales bacterium]